MAGMPPSVVRRADEILLQLEDTHRKEGLSKPLEGMAEKREGFQMSIFQLDDPVLKQIRDEIKNLDINELTPLEALNKLNDIKKITGLDRPSQKIMLLIFRVNRFCLFLEKEKIGIYLHRCFREALNSTFKPERKTAVSTRLQDCIMKMASLFRNAKFRNCKICENSSVGRARPCQGRGREFESRFSLFLRRPGWWNR